jgi:hypothetical protein
MAESLALHVGFFLGTRPLGRPATSRHQIERACRPSTTPRPYGLTDLSGPPQSEQSSMPLNAGKLRSLAIGGRELMGRSRITLQRAQQQATAVNSWLMARNGSMTTLQREIQDVVPMS